VQFHDIETERLQRTALSNAPPYLRLFSIVESYRMWPYERKVAACFPVITMTEHDRQLLLKGQARIKCVNNIKVVPLAVNCERYRPAHGRFVETAKRDVVFVGPADYYKNAISLLWFVQEVFPLVRSVIPEACLRIVNISRGSPMAKRLSTVDGISMVGYKDDIRVELAKASVIIAPMQIASGMSGRVLTALAMAKPLVATSMACQGIEIVRGEHAWIADNPEDFARGVCRLLTNASLAHIMGQCGRKLVEQRYELRHVAVLLEQTLAHLISRG